MHIVQLIDKIKEHMAVCISLNTYLTREFDYTTSHLSKSCRLAITIKQFIALMLFSLYTIAVYNLFTIQLSKLLDLLPEELRLQFYRYFIFIATFKIVNCEESRADTIVICPNKILIFTAEIFNLF